MIDKAIWITFFSALGLLGVNLFLSIVWIATGYFGKAVFKRLRRIYHLNVIGYWLEKLEREGTHCFEKENLK